MLRCIFQIGCLLSICCALATLESVRALKGLTILLCHLHSSAGLFFYQLLSSLGHSRAGDSWERPALAPKHKSLGTPELEAYVCPHTLCNTLPF
jgi:hypothetical protein